MGERVASVAGERHGTETGGEAYVSPLVDFLLVAVLTLTIALSTGVLLLVP